MKYAILVGAIALALAGNALPAASAATMPAYPAWSSKYLGKPVHELFPETTTCEGNLELVLARYGGSRPGAKLEGWGFDTSAAKPVARVLIVDEKGIVVGAGQGGSVRFDVPKNSPQVTSNTTGWFGFVGRNSGWVEAWGIADPPQTVCRIGGIKL